MSPTHDGDAEVGVSVIEQHLKTLPSSPGVYRMIDQKGDVLYVGKAKNLKKRVVAYTAPDRQSMRIRRMIRETAAMEFVTTHTEAEALLLESNMIKRFAPKYNILLRDDKSFPFILVTSGHDFPQVLKHRGAQNKKGDYFGPFASVWAVNETLAVLQRAFLLRTCTDTVFANRSRPCLLHQIKRCAAPCVGKVSADDYQTLVAQARNFLSGGSQAIQKDFARKMQTASDGLEFEVAGQYRDRIRALTRVQARQDINMQGVGEADVIAAHQEGGITCIQVFFFRTGANFGNRSYFPSQARDVDLPEILEAFMGQFYAKTIPPKTVFISHPVPNTELLAEALSVRAGANVKVLCPKRGDKRKIIDHALANAKEAHGRRMAESASQRRLLERLQDVFKLDRVPERIEVYDNSHVSGSKAVGGMIVAGPEGFMKNAYRKFTIKGAAPTGGRVGVDGFAAGDDYAMMKEVLTRRFSRALREDPDKTSGQWPDLVLLDGGKGQLSMGLEVFEELGIDDIAIAAIAKGPDRNAGRERIFLSDRSPAIELEPRNPTLYFLQRLRDEAHRFAIGSHRQKRSRAISRSLLDEIPNVGAKRKKALLHHFGGPEAVAQAGRSDLEATEGINKALANKIYDWFHPDG
ncbi:MAG: excinuclease ABC subunit UvrC [Rhodospirillales bacterium]|nr:excinuclease ABC subunit UvrC [Rhodospirillales bacterium]